MSQDTLEKVVRTCGTPWSVFRNSHDGRINKNTYFCLSLSGSLGLAIRTWKHKRGQNTRDNRHVRQQRDMLRCDAGGNFLNVLTLSSAVHQAQCDTPLQVGHRRCGSAAGACRSAQVRLTLLRTLLSRLWRDVLGEEFIVGMECGGLRAALVVAVGTQASRPRLVFAAQVRGGASCPFRRRLSSPCPVHDNVVE